MPVYACCVVFALTISFSFQLSSIYTYTEPFSYSKISNLVVIIGLKSKVHLQYFFYKGREEVVVVSAAKVTDECLF